jgi:hypothetical protein
MMVLTGLDGSRAGRVACVAAAHYQRRVDRDFGDGSFG